MLATEAIERKGRAALAASAPRWRGWRAIRVLPPSPPQTGLMHMGCPSSHLMPAPLNAFLGLLFDPEEHCSMDSWQW